MHDYHDALPGYSPNQILHDGCRECEARATADDGGLSRLDDANFARAWDRALRWNREGLTDIAKAETRLLHILWAVHCRIEGIGLYLGHLR